MTALLQAVGYAGLNVHLFFSRNQIKLTIKLVFVRNQFKLNRHV